MYDVTDVTSPELVQVFHLSPESETKNPVVAYEDRTLGEIDAESIIFFDEESSPSGKAAILFAGAWSTTTSFREFDCGASEEVAEPSSEEPDDADAEPVETDSTPSSGIFLKGSLLALTTSVIMFLAM